MQRKPKKRKTDFSRIAQNIEKSLGTGSIQRFEKVRFLSTGILSIDWAFGGGVPIGRLTEVFGDFSSGKTLLAMHTLVETQKQEGLAVFADTEFALSIAMAKNIGLDLRADRFIYSKPGSLEEVFNFLDVVVDAAKRENPDRLTTIVWDSVASASPEAELKNPTGTPEMGLRARLINQGLRRLIGKISETNITFLFTNQLMQRIGVLYGPKWTTAGGEAPRIYSSVRVKLAKKAKMMDGKKVIGRFGELEVIKNKIAPPFRKINFAVDFKKGILPLSGYLDCLVLRGVITERGSWYYFGKEKFQKKDFPNFLEKYLELRKPEFGE